MRMELWSEAGWRVLPAGEFLTEADLSVGAAAEIGGVCLSEREGKRIPKPSLGTRDFRF